MSIPAFTLSLFADEMRHRAAPPDPKFSVMRLGLPELDQGLHILGREGRVREENDRRSREQRDRLEILQAVVRHLRLQCRIGCVRAHRDEQRVAIGRRLRDRLRADHVARRRAGSRPQRAGPSSSFMRCASRRPSVSTEPPGANGTIIWIGFSGYLSVTTAAARRVARREQARGRRSAARKNLFHRAQLPFRSWTSGKNKSFQDFGISFQRSDAVHEGGNFMVLSGTMVQLTCGPDTTAVTLSSGQPRFHSSIHIFSLPSCGPCP